MASFETHIGGAALTSAMAASATVLVQWASLDQGILLFVLGTVGGILPDIDSDSSRPVNWLFNLLAAGASVLFLWLLTPWLAIWEVSSTHRLLWGWGGMLVVWLVCGPLAMQLFFRFTVHRGLFHSLLAALFFGMLAVLIASHLAYETALFSWLCGLFVSGGFVVHLLLDEAFSVDFNNLELKKSFGTAIKPFSLDNWLGSLLLAMICSGMLLLSPPLNQLPLEVHWFSNSQKN